MEIRSTTMDDGTQPDWEFFTIAVTMTTVAGVFVILRLGARLYTTYSLAWKDYFLAIAMVGLLFPQQPIRFHGTDDLRTGVWYSCHGFRLPG